MDWETKRKWTSKLKELLVFARNSSRPSMAAAVVASLPFKYLVLFLSHWNPGHGTPGQPGDNRGWETGRLVWSAQHSSLNWRLPPIRVLAHPAFPLPSNLPSMHLPCSRCEAQGKQGFTSHRQYGKDPQSGQNTYELWLRLIYFTLLLIFCNVKSVTRIHPLVHGFCHIPMLFVHKYHCTNWKKFTNLY